jgi:phosphopantothenoylcysteine decarboxylase/phosphopantothenate--cysteine ligase
MNTLIITGAPSAAFVPGVLATLNKDNVGQNLNIIMTRSAHSFVTPAALSVFSKTKIIQDRFGEIDHQVISHKSEKVFVYPTTFNFVNKVSSGITDTLSLMVAQLTLDKLHLYVSLPEGLNDNATYIRNRSLLQNAGVTFIEAEVGLALSSKKVSEGGCPAPNKLWYDLKSQAKKGNL